MVSLCVNIDHIATLRQARREEEPDPLEAARLVEKAGAHGITVHLREDRRHIQDADVLRLRKTVRTKLNLEMAAIPEMVGIALKVRPDQVTLVPEKRRELTTEGGLSLRKGVDRVQRSLDHLQSRGIPVSLFIDPSFPDIHLASRMGATFIELHTGAYSQVFRRGRDASGELARLVGAVLLATSLGLRVHAGHGLTYRNTGPIAMIPGLEDLNIGHNIVARASSVGMERAVREMLGIIRKASRSRDPLGGSLRRKKGGKP